MRALAFSLMLSIGVICAGAFANNERLDLLWGSAIQSFEQKDNPRAIELFNQWLDEAKQTDTQSAEVHHNLALSYWAIKDSVHTAYHLLKSISLRSSPFRIWKELQTLNDVERRLGTPSALSDSLLFQVSFLLNENILTLLFTLGFWMLFIGFLWRRLASSKFPALRYLLMLSALGLWMVTLVGYVNQRHLSRFAVLQGNGSIAALYASPRTDEKEKPLVELPAGTLIQFGQHSQGYTEVIFPVAGWAKKEDVLF